MQAASASPFLVGREEVAPVLVAKLECPEELSYIWMWFEEMEESRQAMGFGPMRLSEADMQAWQSNHQVRLTVFELRVLRRLETLYLSSISEQASQTSS